MNAKTFVLVHGAYHGGWCWKHVSALLRAEGHAAYAPTCTGLGDRSHLVALNPALETHIEDVAQVLRYEDLRDVILVGHSFGGSIVSALADRMPQRLRHLVYLDALLLRSGESSADRSPKRAELYAQRARDGGNGLLIPPWSPEHYGISDPALAAWVRDRLAPHPLRCYHDRLQLEQPLGNGLPATYIACTLPLFPATESSRELAHNMHGWSYLELAAGHDAMLTAAPELARMLIATG